MEERSKKTRIITDASVIVAIYMVFLFFSRMTGSMLEYELFLFLPIPLAIYAYKYDLKASLIPAGATFLLSFIFVDFINALTIIFPALFIGALFGGFLAKRKIKFWINILIITSICVLKEVLVCITFASLLDMPNIFQEISLLCQKTVNILQKMNISYITEAYLTSLINGIIPTIMVGTGIIEALCIYIIFNLLSYRMKLCEKMDFKLQENLLFPSSIVGYVYLVLMILSIPAVSLFEKWGDVQFLLIIVINLFLILSIYMLYQGFTLAAIYGKSKGKTSFVFLFVLLSLIFIPLTCILGAFDAIFKLKFKILLNIRNTNNQ